MPPGTSFSGELHPAEDVVFFKDLTFIDADGKRQVSQEIFDEAFKIIANAEKFILLDMFLYNDFQGSIPVRTRALSSELTNLLITQKKKYSAMEIFVITDPVNTVYGGMPSKQFSLLKESGIWTNSLIAIFSIHLSGVFLSNPLVTAQSVLFQILSVREVSLFAHT
jgi:hypothetical protein